ncbi:MAG: hypothetical protein J1E60_07145 [Christensenellaceae bacterium]|nr:hypothetical protein [Christensenellaceae bacterium]
MTKKQLQRYRGLVSEREDIKALISELETEYASLRPSKLDGLPKGTNTSSDRMADILIRRDELLSMYRGKIESIAAELRAIENAIDGLEPTERRLMRYRYIDGLSWEEVATRMAYSTQRTYQLHGRTLKKIRVY